MDLLLDLLWRAVLAVVAWMGFWTLALVAAVVLVGIVGRLVEMGSRARPHAR
jgi:hypothetical protein